MGSGDWPLGDTVPPSLESVALEFWLRLDEALGHVVTKGVSRTVVLGGSSWLDLEQRSASEEVDASPSLHSNTKVSVGVVFVTRDRIGSGQVWETTLPWGCCSTWFSLTTGGVCPLGIGKGALTQRTGGSTMPCDGACVAELIEGSGLRSDGGIRSGLEDVHLLGFGVKSKDFMFKETSPKSSDVE